MRSEAARLADRPVVTAPAFHLGDGAPHAGRRGRATTRRRRTSCSPGRGWEDDGYRLFEISTPAGSSGRGLFGPMGESSSLFCSPAIWEELGGLDERFALPGGGLVNHDLYRRACALPSIELVVLLGEGTFHQYHGGAATSRRHSWDEMHADYEAIRGEPHRPPANRAAVRGHESRPPCSLHRAVGPPGHRPDRHGTAGSRATDRYHAGSWTGANGRSPGGPQTRGTATEVPIAITGMHRSGTSMITRALHDSGLHLIGTGAEELIDAAEDNPEGFWENKAIVACNDELLEATGGAWDNPPELPPLAVDDPRVAHIGDASTAALAALSEHDHWGFKDPRTCLTAAYWLDLEPELRFIICVRHPLEVALSLKRRNQNSYSLGLALWERYYATGARAGPGRAPDRHPLRHVLRRPRG